MQQISFWSIKYFLEIQNADGLPLELMNILRILLLKLQYLPSNYEKACASSYFPNFSSMLSITDVAYV